MRKRIVAANWKMHGKAEDIASYIEGLHKGSLTAEEEHVNLAMAKEIDPPEVIACFPFPYLSLAATYAPARHLRIGAQNMHYEEKGAFTGEVSPSMLKDCLVTHVIIGHSERRDLFGETDDMIQKKVQAALSHGLLPILCVGESLALREAGEDRAVAFVKDQLRIALEGVTAEQMKTMIIAYEPIWAIGTGKTATAEQAQAMCKAIRDFLATLAGEEAAQAVRILYGGSVKTDNIFQFISQEDIDGALVGGASLSADTFNEIIERCDGLYVG